MNARPVQVLLVEDDDAHAQLVELVFSEHRIAGSLDRVVDGEEALAYLQNQGPYAGRPRPDVILLDLKLPKVDGHEVLARIKSDDAFRRIPVVILTTSAAPLDRRLAYGNYANSYLTKPLEFDKFQKMVKDLGIYWSVWNQPP